METIIKQTRELGTSAGVLLPRKWLNKQVAVTLLFPSADEISKNVLKILFEKNLNEEIKGIYLVGSYSRGEQDINSDIDILVITHKINALINSDNYEILLVSEDNFSRDLSYNLNYLSMIREIKVILNRELIEKYRNQKPKLNIGKILTEIKKVLEINSESVKILEEKEKNIPDGIVYSVVLRLRELYLIKILLSKKPYSKKSFVKIVGNEIYSAYLRVKRNEKELNNVSSKDINKLLELFEQWLKELKG